MHVLPGAAKVALADPESWDGAIVPALADALGRTPAAARHIRFFHGTRMFDLQTFVDRGLLPLSMVLDEIWDRLRGLAHEVSDDAFAAFREGLEDGPIRT